MMPRILQILTKIFQIILNALQRLQEVEDYLYLPKALAVTLVLVCLLNLHCKPPDVA